MSQETAETYTTIPQDDIAAIKAVAQYVHQLRSLTIIRLLNPVIIACQKYRGANTALLDGNNDYSGKVDALINEINRRFVTLKILNHDYSGLIPANEIEQLELEWHTVRTWSGENTLELFKLNSHFIEQQIRILSSVATKANSFSLLPVTIRNMSSNNNLNVQNPDDKLLIQFVIREIPELIENIAKIRGLATHAAILGYCDGEHHSWLEYLLNTLNQKKEKFRTISESLQYNMLGELPALLDMQIQDVKIVQLVQIVNQYILRNDRIQFDNHAIFDMASGIIESHSTVFNQGLGFIRRKIDRALDEWHTAA